MHTLTCLQPREAGKERVICHGSKVGWVIPCNVGLVGLRQSIASDFLGFRVCPPSVDRIWLRVYQNKIPICPIYLRGTIGLVRSRAGNPAQPDLEVLEAFCLPALGGILLGARVVGRESPNPELIDDQVDVVCLHRFRMQTLGFQS